MSALGKLLIWAGVGLVLLGLALVVAARWGWTLRHLPGDLVFRRKNLVIFVPLGTMVVLSLVATWLLHLWQRWGR